MPTYNRGDPPQSPADVPRFLREELGRVQAYARAPRTDGAWDDLRFPAQGINAPGPAGAPTWDSTNIGLAFSSTLDNDIQCIAQLPHSWREGTNVRPHIHWEAGTGFTPGQAVVWTMSYRWRNNGGTLGALTTSTITVTPTNTLVLMISAFPELDGTGKNISSIIDIQISRLAASAAADNLGATAILKEFDIHYRVDSLGSDMEYAK